MLIFISIVHIIVTACFCILLYEAIQTDEALGFWQEKVLEPLYAKKHFLLERFLGGCMKCFSHLISILAFPVFLFIQWKMDLWIGWWNVALYFVLIPVSIILAQLLFKKLNQ
jgi:hypothetical protein